ncbi:BON domain-containing protein [Flavihumibacter sp.]|uniref:BON domain-containing protein n=1 Tax=Flavihumibacter sp. TaxID=1913981 RepID=UPI002FCA2AEA|nr:BON domain-containing protein [Flavihumibacter sediminis]
MKRIGRVLLGLAIASAVSLTACKPKDTDIEKNVTTAVAGYPGVSVSVNDGVATISGEVADESTKAAVETAAKSVKGVKSVTNNLSVPPPPPPVEISADATLQQTVASTLTSMGLGQVVATVNDGVVTLTGEIKKADLPNLMQKLNELKPKKIENKLTIK